MKNWMNFHNKTFRKAICNLSILVALLIGYVALNYQFSFSLSDQPLAVLENRNYVFLSDLSYITDNNWSYNGWGGHEIQMDKNQEGGILSLLVHGEKRLFSKGIGLHAKGQVTFDISQYSTDFPRFIAQIGVDASRGSNGSIWFKITASRDGSTWVPLINKSDVLTGSSDAINVDLDVTGYKYLCIYLDPNGSNASDHGTIANARLVTKNFNSNIDNIVYDKIHKVNDYDEILATKDSQYNYERNYKLVLEREFVRKMDFWNIQYLAETDSNVVSLLDWILSDNQLLEYVIEVGEIYNPTTFLNIMSNIYQRYKNEFKTKNGYVYEKMMVGLAAGYSTDRLISPLSFSFPAPNYDYMERFSLVKQLFDTNQLMRLKTNALSGEFVPNEWFKDYHVQLMRMVMNDATSNMDFIWLNGYTREKQSLNYHMIPYLSPNYNQSKLYDEANRELYDNKYFLSKYHIPYGERVQHYWMVIEAGGICWNASRFAQSMHRVQGIPATGAYQPGHELYIHYYQDDNGNGYWTPRYGNWGNAGSTWGGGQRYRYLFDWGNKYFTDQNISGSKGGTSTGYIYLGQANLNHYEQYKKSLYYNLIANSYTNNNQKLATYFKALEFNNINLDSYDSIISIYKNMSVKNEGGTITSHDWYLLANQIIEAYTYYPVAMFDLLKVIRPYLEGSERLDIDRLEKEALTSATVASGNETIQVDGVRTHARQLLGKAQPDPVTFSFDGENAGKLVKNPSYSLAWGYSLDGGKTFSRQVVDDSVTLSSEELAHITEENDIIINFMGLSYTFRIDITKGQIASNLFPNDLENRVVGITVDYQWRNSETNPWISYRDASPDNTGNKTLYVRKSATGTQLASDSITYQFTEDNQPNTRKYVPVSHLSIHAVSTEATSNQGAAAFAIDGNYTTRWHSAWNGTDTERFITIKLDKPRYVSAVEFVPAGGGNGRIYDGTVWGSYDGETWEKLSELKGVTYPEQANTVEQALLYTKSFEITDPKEVQYIKIVADRTNGNWFTARNFNIFQDLTKNPRPTAGIGYSETEPTSKDVVARLVNASTNITITNNNGSDTYIFTDNGSFTFEFVDEKGTKGSTTVTVTWIDRVAPTATIEYSTNSPINHSVFATLKPNEDVTVTNNGMFRVDSDGNVLDQAGNVMPGYSSDGYGTIIDENGNVVSNADPLKYEFITNGEFTFEFVDRAGNRGSATARVNWIDFDPPVASLTYDKTMLTNQDVTVTVDFNENTIIKNNNGNNTYTFTDNGSFTFEFSDAAGNKNQITADVNWIDKVAPTAELRYEIQGSKVIVRVVNPSEAITFQEGIGVYEFTQNGSYDITFYDQVGNMSKLTAIINDLKNPTNNSSENKPNNSNTNKPNSTSKPNGTNKPNSTSAPSPSTGSNNTNQPNSSGNGGSVNTTQPTNKEYRKFQDKDITVEILRSAVSTGTTLEVNSFELDDFLKDKIGQYSEFYDIHLLNTNSKRIEINTSTLIKISINTMKTKKFLGVYELTKENELKEVEYERNGNSIEILTNKLGKYVISYDELDETDAEIPKKTKYGNILLIILIIGMIITILDLVFYFLKKARMRNQGEII